MTWEIQPDGTWVLHGDVRGKTIDEIMVVTEQLVDEAIEDTMQSSEIELRDIGASDDVIAAQLQEVMLIALARKRTCLTNVRRGLIEGSERSRTGDPRIF